MTHELNPGAARSGPPWNRPLPGGGRSWIWQDPRSDAPSGPSDCQRDRSPVGGHGGDVHQQGGPGDGHTGRRAARRTAVWVPSWAPSIAGPWSSCATTRSRRVCVQASPSSNRDEQRSLVVRAMRDVGVDDASLPPRRILHTVSTAINRSLSPSGYLREARDRWAEQIAEVWQRYAALKESANALDFGRYAGALRAHAHQLGGPPSWGPAAAVATCWWTSFRTPTPSSCDC